MPDETTPVMTGAGLVPEVKAAIQALGGTTGKEIIQDIVTGGEEFLTGAPIDIKVDAGSGLTFTAKNPWGQEYTFTATGSFTLKGSVQGS